MSRAHAATRLAVAPSTLQRGVQSGTCKCTLLPMGRFRVEECVRGAFCHAYNPPARQWLLIPPSSGQVMDKRNRHSLRESAMATQKGNSNIRSKSGVAPRDLGSPNINSHILNLDEKKKTAPDPPACGTCGRLGATIRAHVRVEENLEEDWKTL